MSDPKEAIWEAHYEKCERGGGCDCRAPHCVHDSWEEEWCNTNDECIKEVQVLIDNLPEHDVI